MLGEQLETTRNQSRKPVLINGDSDRILQIIDNIIDNAIKHTSKENRKIVITPEINSSNIRIIIADNGEGISSEDINKIFSPFMSIDTKYSTGGTGIGLYLSKILANSHGGTLSAFSKGKGFGTTFTIELPLINTNS